MFFFENNDNTVNDVSKDKPINSKRKESNKNNENRITQLKEALICFEYLKNYASEVEPATQQDIVTYAKDIYNINIRRDRIRDYIDVFTSVFNESPEFNYTVKKVGVRSYIEDTSFNYNDKKTIIESISLNPNLSVEEKQMIIEKFRDSAYTNESDSEAKNILGRVSPNFDIQYDEAERKNAKILSDFDHNEYLFTIKLSKEGFRINHLKLEDNSLLIKDNLYYIKSAIINDSPIAYFVDQDLEVWSYFLETFKILNRIENKEKIRITKKRFKDAHGMSINEYMNLHGVPLNSELMHIQFLVNQEDFDYVKKSFISFFKLPLQYTEKKNKINKIYICSCDVEMFSFCQWAQQGDLLLRITIYKTPLVENKLFFSIIDLLKKTINAFLKNTINGIEIDNNKNNEINCKDYDFEERLTDLENMITDIEFESKEQIEDMKKNNYLLLDSDFRNN